MTTVNFHIVSLLILLSCTNQNLNPERTNTDNVFSRKELNEDLFLLKKVLIDAHPGIYWYNNPSSIESIFNEVQRSLAKEETEIEFYRKTLALISRINCGHTWINASNPLSDSLWNNIDDFPVEVKIIDQRLFYTGADVPNSISRGDEIHAINGRKSSEVLKLMLNYTVGDGFIQTGRNRMVERRFGFYYALLYGFERDYKISYSTNEENGLIANFPSKGAAMNEVLSDPIQFSFRKEHRAGILKIASFPNERIDQNGAFQSRLQDIFTSLNHSETEHLVIDLRDNRGGSDEMGLLLLSHLMTDSVTEFNKMYMRTIDSELLKKYSDLSPDIYEQLPQVTRQENDTTFVLTDEAAIQPFAPSAFVFEGTIYVLINGNTFSTAADVCSILYSNGRATFIGEETGGGYYGNTSGLVTRVTLPNTGFQLQLPLVRYETNVKDTLPEGSGVKPDFRFSVSQKGFLSNEDLMLEYALNLINDN